MYFHNGLTDFILWDTWVPCTVPRYIGALVAIFVTGLFTGFLKGVHARLEQRWMIELSDDPPQPEGSWGFLPTGKQRWMNLVRSFFVFVVVTLDYALMLAAMTFNYGIFFAVVLGMAAGSLFFGHTVVPIRTRPSPQPYQEVVGGRGAVELEVENMTCGKCVGRVERALRGVPGVVAVAVDLAAGRAQVEGDGDVTAMLAVLEEGGYPARRQAQPSSETQCGSIESSSNFPNNGHPHGNIVGACKLGSSCCGDMPL